MSRSMAASRESEVEERFVCPICCEVFKQPVYIQTCKHVFCASCIQQAPPSPDGTVPCPVCRTPFLYTELRTNAVLKQDIATAIVTCRTCAVKCKLSCWNEHCIQNHVTAPLPSTQHSTRPPAHNRSTFQCPLCLKKHLSSTDLLAHVNSFHSNSRDLVVCPICVAMPWGVADQVSQDFITHLNTRHKFEYDTYVDYAQDEDATLQAVIKASVTDQ